MSPLHRSESGSSVMAAVAVIIGLLVLGFFFFSSATMSSTSMVTAISPASSSSQPGREEQINTQLERLQQQLFTLYPSVRGSSEGTGNEERFSQESRYEIQGQNEQAIGTLYIDLDYRAQSLDIEVNMDPAWNPELKSALHSWLEDWQGEASARGVTLSHNLISN